MAISPQLAPSKLGIPVVPIQGTAKCTVKVHWNPQTPYVKVESLSLGWSELTPEDIFLHFVLLIGDLV